MTLTHPGELFENPVTGERGVVRVPPRRSNGHLLVVDLYVRPGGAVADTIQFTTLPRPLRRLLPAALYPIARATGHRAIDPNHLRRELPTVELEPLPAEIAELVPSLSSRPRWPNSTTTIAAR
jgi:hypothetical protein